MASEQLARRENKTTEREVHVEKDRVPKMATHFEHLADKTKDSDLTGGKETPQGSIEALQGGEYRKDHAGKSIGDVGGAGKARESHELGTRFESLADKVKGNESDHPANVAGAAAGAGPIKERERGGRVGDVGKFEMQAEGKGDKRELERRTKEVTGRKEKERGGESIGQVVAEKGARAEEKARGRTGAGAENEGATAVITCRLEKGEEGRGSGIEEEIPEYRNETKTKATQTQAQETKEKSGMSKETVAPVTEKAKGYTAQAAEKAKSAGGTTAQYVGEKAVQAKDVTVESGKSAAEYAGKVALDLKDKAAAVGWAAAHFSADKTVQGTKAAAQVVEGAAGYAGHKAADLASKSVETVKGLAASAGESAKEYTARKKVEAQRELEAKKAAQPQPQPHPQPQPQPQEAERRPSQGISETVSGQQGKGVLSSIGETVGNVVKKPFTGEGKKESGGVQVVGRQGKGPLATIGEKLGDVADRAKEPLNNIAEGGTEVLGAVGETVGEIGENIGENIIKPAEKAQEHGQEGQRSGMLGAIGETIVEIANTTKVMVTGQGEKESSMKGVASESPATDTAKRQGYQSV